MKTRSLTTLIIVSCALLLSCAQLTLDRQSTDAFAAGDLTLVSSCVATPGPSIALASGVDSCHFTVGDAVGLASWTLVAPAPKNASQVTAVEVDVTVPKFSLHKTYSMTNWTLPIPLVDLFGPAWQSAHDETIIEALATITWKDDQNIAHVLQTRSIALVLVTAAGYDRMAIDSGNAAWGTTCKAQFSTAGRSAVSCK